MPYLSFVELLHDNSSSSQSSGLPTTPTNQPFPAVSPQLPRPLYSEAVPLSVDYNVSLTHATTLSKLYHYPVGTTVEYPETTDSPAQSIGHLFTMSHPSELYNPTKDFAYSIGSPRGCRKPMYISIFHDICGQLIPCERMYATCQGIKICPFVSGTESHTHATHEALQQQLQCDHSLFAPPTPEQQYFQKTLALWVAIHDGGCPYPAQEWTVYSTEESLANEERDRTPTKARRGQNIKNKCDGQILIKESTHGYLYIVCEHYDSRKSKKHFVNCGITDRPYIVPYLFALLINNTSTVDYWEQYAKENGYGPLMPCTRLQNTNSVKVNCPYTHHSLHDQTMYMTEMIQLPCNAKFTTYIPLSEYRDQYPQALVVCHSPHTHPIPLPSTTPEPIKQSLKAMLLSLDQDLPDITPRRLL